MTKVKSNSVITTQVESGVITFKVKDAGELMLDTAKLSAGVRERAMLHGLVQRVSDRAAISRDTKTGKAASPQDKLAAMRRLVEHYETGTEMWNMDREGGVGGPSQEVVLLVKGLCELYPSRTEEQVRDWVKKRSKEERSALMASEKLKVIVDRLRAEQAEGVDAEGLLGELSEGESEGEGEGDEASQA